MIQVPSTSLRNVLKVILRPQAEESRAALRSFAPRTMTPQGGSAGGRFDVIDHCQSCRV